jgi:prepilin signal peptidase PulO-like enzyme (type II secretory pathway)
MGNEVVLHPHPLPALFRHLVIMLFALSASTALGQDPTPSDDTSLVAYEPSIEKSETSPPLSSRSVNHSPSDELTDAQRSNIWKLEIFTHCWFLVLGATVGSFLNVVIYRLPVGRRLLGWSHCPSCNQRLSWRENMPIVGWLRLLGRCRTCKVRIPVRYPAVEASIAMLFVVLLVTELLPGGTNLPVRTPNGYAGVVWIIWYTKWDLVGIYLFHCFLGCVLIAAALIQWDGHALPRRLAVFATATGVIAPVFWRHLHPVSFHIPSNDWLAINWRWHVDFQDPVSGWSQQFGVGLDGLLDSVIGLMAGLLTGWLIARCLGPGAFFSSNALSKSESELTSPEHPQRGHVASFCILFGLATTFLGWQFAAPLAISVGAFAVLLSSVSRVTGDLRWQHRTTSTAIAAAVLIQLPFWRTLSTLDFWPGHAGWPMLMNCVWWPFPSLEPYASLALAVAAGCVIAMAHSLVGNAEVSPGSEQNSVLQAER